MAKKRKWSKLEKKYYKYLKDKQVILKFYCIQGYYTKKGKLKFKFKDYEKI